MSEAPTRPLTVLVTACWLDNRGGVAAAIRDITQGLLRRGHRPIVYSPHIGEPAYDMRRHGVAIVDDLSLIKEAPDVIHGQHLIQTAEALLRFPGTPAIQMCHAFLFWQEGPAKFPQVHRYVAVDQAVRDRLVHAEGIAPEKVDVLYNAVDLSRFPSSRAPLPDKPRRAVAFTKSPAHVPLIEAACRRHGIELDVLGRGGGRTTAHPEAELVKYDLVFGAARTALEALTAGCAVVVCDQRGLAGMASLATLPQLRPLNFGLRTLVHPVTVGRLAEEIGRYDAEDAARTAQRVRLMASIEPVLDHLLKLYGEAMAQPPPDAAALSDATWAFLQAHLPRRRADPRWPWMAERDELTARVEHLEQELAAARRAAPA